jgi:hypothetical protein
MQHGQRQGMITSSPLHVTFTRISSTVRGADTTVGIHQGGTVSWTNTNAFVAACTIFAVYSFAQIWTSLSAWIDDKIQKLDYTKNNCTVTKQQTTISRWGDHNKLLLRASGWLEFAFVAICVAISAANFARAQLFKMRNVS